MSGFIGLIGKENQVLPEACMIPVAACCREFTGAWKSDHADLRFALMKGAAGVFKEELPYSTDQNLRIIGDVRLDRRTELISILAEHFTYLDKSFPDSYLVLHAYMLWGGDCVNRIAGDYSFAIWNEEEQSLFCVRDHFGIIPFYYAETEEGFLFTNFYRALKEYPGLMEELNEEILKNYFILSINGSATDTIYQKIRKLPPAHTLSYKKGELTIKEYWQPDRAAKPLRYGTTAEYVAHFTEIFMRSVSDRITSPHTASQLSGGMDSSSITALARKTMDEKYPEGFDLLACNITYRSLVSENEGYFAKLIADHLAIPLRRYVAEDYLGKISLTLNTWLPEPGGIPHASPEKAMIKDLEDKCDLLLAGFGGDPLFMHDPRSWLNVLKRGGVSQFFKDLTDYTKMHGRPPGMGLKQWIKRKLKRKKGADQLPAWLSKGFISDAGYLERMQPSGRSRLNNTGMFLNTTWQNIFEMSHPGFNNSRVKVRYPFFCLELSEFIYRIPPHLLANKSILRAAMAAFLPPEVVARPKTPLFGNAYLNNLRSSDVLRELKAGLNEEHAFIKDKINIPLVQDRLDAAHRLQRSDQAMLISLIHILAWKKARGQD